MTSARFFLDQDSSLHWYIVPVARRAEWEKWRAIPETDKASWAVPEWAERSDGPYRLTFTDPVEA